MGANVDYEEFVEAWLDVWEAGGTSAHVAKQLGIKQDTIAARATYLRSKGVKLPYLTKRGMLAPADVSVLNAAISRRQRTMGEEPKRVGRPRKQPPI